MVRVSSLLLLEVNSKAEFHVAWLVCLNRNSPELIRLAEIQVIRTDRWSKNSVRRRRGRRGRAELSMIQNVSDLKTERCTDATFLPDADIL